MPTSEGLLSLLDLSEQVVPLISGQPLVHHAQIELAGIPHLFIQDRGSIVADSARGRSRVQLYKHLFKSGHRRAPSLAERPHIFGPLSPCKAPGAAQLPHLWRVMRRGSTEKKHGALSPIEIITLQDRAGRSIELLRIARFSYSFMRIPKCFRNVERPRLRVFEPFLRVCLEEISDAIVFLR